MSTHVDVLAQRLRDVSRRHATGGYDTGGHRHDAKDAADAIEDMATALKVIHTWATFNGGQMLISEHVANLCRKALHREEK